LTGLRLRTLAGPDFVGGGVSRPPSKARHNDQLATVPVRAPAVSPKGEESWAWACVTVGTTSLFLYAEVVMGRTSGRRGEDQEHLTVQAPSLADGDGRSNEFYRRRAVSACLERGGDDAIDWFLWREFFMARSCAGRTGFPEEGLSQLFSHFLRSGCTACWRFSFKRGQRWWRQPCGDGLIGRWIRGGLRRGIVRRRRRLKREHFFD